MWPPMDDSDLQPVNKSIVIIIIIIIIIINMQSTAKLWDHIASS